MVSGPPTTATAKEAMPTMAQTSAGRAGPWTTRARPADQSLPTRVPSRREAKNRPPRKPVPSEMAEARDFIRNRMAMALMVQPVLLLLDEPSAGLSPLAAEQLFATIREISREGIAIAMVEQNAVEALQIAHRATILVDGRNNREGAAATLRADPEIRRIFLGAHPAEQQ